MTKAQILAIDTALDGCAVAVARFPAGSVFTVDEAMTRGQSERLVPMCGKAIAATASSYADLTHIAVTVGPGAFTGLRIGIATAKLFALALDIPVIGVTTTAAIARHYRMSGLRNCAVILETKRDDFYVQTFIRDEAESPVEALDARALAARLPPDILLIGDGARRFLDSGAGAWDYDPNYDRPKPAIVADLAYEVLNDGNITSVKPIYLREADVSIAKNAGRKIIDI